MQLAVVKSGPALEFYRDAQPAGTATAAYVVNDYGAEVLALGVDYSRLVEPGSNATGIDPAALSGPVGGWGLAGWLPGCGPGDKGRRMHCAVQPQLRCTVMRCFGSGVALARPIHLPPALCPAPAAAGLAERQHRRH